MSFTALHGIYKLVEENILVGSKTVSTLVALLPAVIHCNALISTIGSILLLDLKEQIAKNKTYNEFYGSEEILHPFVMILKTNGEKSWCEIYFFVNNVIQNCNDM